MEIWDTLGLNQTCGQRNMLTFSQIKRGRTLVSVTVEQQLAHNFACQIILLYIVWSSILTYV